MLITDYLNRDCIILDLEAESKEVLIARLADIQFKKHPEINRDEAMAGLLERESILSTAIGNGVAIPHARLVSSRDITVAVGLIRGETDFDAIDNQPVRMIFLVFFPKDNVNLQLRFLARISRLLKQASFNEELLSCQSPQEVIDTFTQFEAQHFH